MPRHEPSGRIARHLAQLWQVPLLLVSLALFGGAAYLLLDPQAEMSSQQKIQRARAFLKTDRPDAAVEQLVHMLAAGKMQREDEAIVHLTLAEAIDASMKRRGVSDVAEHQQIIEQTQIGLTQGAKANGEINQRVGDSLVALGKPAEAITRYREAIAVDPAHAVALSRKIIELQVSRGDTSAGASIDQYLARRDIADSERAWALTNKSQLLINAGDYFEARSLLRDAVRLNDDAQAVGAASFRIAQSALKLGSLGEAERAARVAHDQLSSTHIDKPSATFLLAEILREKKEFANAAVCYDELLKNYPKCDRAPMAMLGRAVCQADKPEIAASDLRELSQVAKKDDRKLLAAMSVQEKSFKADALVELLSSEIALQSAPATELSQRLALAIQDRMTSASTEQLKELCPRLAKAIDQFATTKPDDALAADALLHVAAAQTHLGSTGDAAATHQRILENFGETRSASAAALELAKFSLAKSEPDNAAAERFLIRVAATGSKASADERKQASAELAMLYARTDRQEQAIAQLELLIKKYPNDARSIEFLSLLAECYRAKAGAPEAHLASAQLADAKSVAAGAESFKQQNLLKAKEVFDKIVALDNSKHSTDDKIRIERAHVRRADCLYDLGKFVDAIPLYESAAKKYDNQPASLAAYVQLVNCFCEIEKPDEAKAAHAHAVAILAQHADAGSSVPKAYWELWLKRTSQEETK